MEKEVKGQVVFINPYDLEHMRLLCEFENEIESNLPIKTSQILKQIVNSKSEKEYLIDRSLSNEISENAFYFIDGVFKSSCYIEGDKEQGKVELTLFTPTKFQHQGYASVLLSLVEEKLFKEADIDTIEMVIEKNNKASRNLARKRNFELYDDFGVYQIFVKNNTYKLEGEHYK